MVKKINKVVKRNKGNLKAANKKSSGLKKAAGKGKAIKIKKKIVKKPQPAHVKRKMTQKKVIKKPSLIKSKKKAAKNVAPVSPVLGPLGIEPYVIKKGEAYMSKKQLLHFEKILTTWKSQLMAEVDRTIYDMQDVASYADPIDRASQEEEFSVKLRERDRERKLLKKIDEALLRIKEGLYGFCDECGAEIGIRRLEARPTATQCIDCKTISEIREKQTAI